MEHLTYDLELSIMEHGGTIYLGMISDIYEDHKNLRNIFTKLVLSIWHHRWFGIDQDYDLEKCYHLEKQKSLSMSLARESYAKKIRTTPWTKNSRLRVEQLDLSIWSH